MGGQKSRTRNRADYVLETFIKPACRELGYRAVRADHDDVQDIARGITTALQNAPLTIAYMGAPHCGADGSEDSPFWNANVMIEIGIRVASRLPLILLSDRLRSGRDPDFPLNLAFDKKIITLPGSLADDPDGPSPLAEEAAAVYEQDVKETIEQIVKRINAERNRVRLLDCKHALASINAASRDIDSPDSLLYTASSEAAEELFGMEDGGRRQLVGRTMAQYLAGLRERMHPVQWKMFCRDQALARKRLKNSKTAVANVPIVFENHENQSLNRRAFLPIIVQEFQRDREGENNWYNLRVLYLNVTNVTKKERLENGDEYYVCDLNPFHEDSLDPLLPFEGIKVFISYTREDYESVERILEVLRDFAPYVDPFIDLGIGAARYGVDELEGHLDRADLVLLFLGSVGARGPGQNAEIRVLEHLEVSSRERSVPKIVPVLLTDGVDVPLLLQPIQRVQYDALDRSWLQQLFVTHFRNRCPDEWVQ